MSTNTEIIQKYLQEFEQMKNQLNGAKANSVFDKRQLAASSLEKLGIPTRKHEEWRYTNLSFLNKIDFSPVSHADDSDFSIDEFAKYFIDDYKKYRLVFINGYFSNNLSNIELDKNSVIAGGLETLLFQNFEPAVDYFSSLANVENDVFSALNTALSPDGCFIYIPDGISASEPVQLLFINDTRMGNPIVQPRNIIIAGENSQAKIVCRYATLGSNDAFVNIVSEGIVNQSANIEFYSIFDDKNSYYINSTDVLQKSNSVFSDFKVNFNGKFVRNNLYSKLDGENCEANYNGLYYLTGEDFADNHTIVDHALPNSHSNEFYKGILDDKSHSVFSGKILVRQDAQKTNAFQSNRNVLLSDNAKINTKPQLEIFADDVKCSHGATSGALDESALFYLQSRGIAKDDAKSMLVMAFANDLLDKFNIKELQSVLRREISERLGLEFEDSLYVNQI